ncbi:hypothetical protein E2P81_ATG10793 [Venturia nashicola]|nr:hypothetical protein E2P81_ATG10793 [Venturia nashicola]
MVEAQKDATFLQTSRADFQPRSEDLKKLYSNQHIDLMGLVHFGIPPSWKNEIHYAPLKDMQPGPAGYLGLVFSNDKEGAEQRIACVHEHIEAFGMRRSVGWEGRLLGMRDRTCVSSLSYRVLRRWRGCL